MVEDTKQIPEKFKLSWALAEHLADVMADVVRARSHEDSMKWIRRSNELVTEVRELIDHCDLLEAKIGIDKPPIV